MENEPWITDDQMVAALAGGDVNYLCLFHYFGERGGRKNGTFYVNITWLIVDIKDWKWNYTTTTATMYKYDLLYMSMTLGGLRWGGGQPPRWPPPLRAYFQMTGVDFIIYIYIFWTLEQVSIHRAIYVLKTIKKIYNIL